MNRQLLLHPHAPIYAGTALVFGLCFALVYGSGAPGNLAKAHSQVPGLLSIDGCEQCHTKSGITNGCLQCHEEIRTQFQEDSGYHGFLEADRGMECAGCHSEHHGVAFPLVNHESWGAQVEDVFRHPHVEFTLEGSHDQLTCHDCHGSGPRFKLPGFAGFPREQSFLGVDPQCETCHVDDHSDGLTGPCLECHDQHEFSEPHFDHGEHLVLSGGHDQVTCGDCHVLPLRSDVEDGFEENAVDLPALPFPFGETRGTTCNECHGNPHRIEMGASCTECHSPDHGHWFGGREKITPALHSKTGFTLSNPHTEVSCDGCHPSELSFEERHPDPSSPGYQRRPETCEGCHEDIHEGQFDGKHDHCVECHSPLTFTPTQFGHEEHASIFDLAGAHSAVACSTCHTIESPSLVRTFVGTPNRCVECHSDPHAGQFDDKIAKDDCEHCHLANADAFTVGHFDHEEQTGFALRGAHTRTSCYSCHLEGTRVHRGVEVTVNVFADTPQNCASCHIDVHRGQFSDYETCAVCHTSPEKFSGITFNHDTQSEWPLTGAHRDVPCAQCHTQELHADGGQVVRYQPIPHECGDCHDIVPDAER